MLWFLGALLAAAIGAGSRTDSTSKSNTDSQTVTYRTRDGRSYFRFRMSQVGGHLRIYILEFPGKRSCHVLRDASGHYICWSGRIHSISAAKAIAATWAEATLTYQRTGRTF